MSQALFNYVGLIGGMLTVPSLILAYLSLRPRRLSWYAVTDTVEVSAENERLKIAYDGEELSDVSFTRAIVWNAGKTAITGEEISKVDPLRIVMAQPTRILYWSVVASTGAAATPTVTLADEHTMLTMHFDFLNRGDGFVWAIVHSGKNNQVQEVRGTVRDVRRVARAFPGIVVKYPRFKWAAFATGVASI